MTTPELQRLYEASKAMNKVWTLEVSGEEEQILPGEYRAACIEHVCHELGHAFLLDVPLGSKLADRIAKVLRRRVEMRSTEIYFRQRDWSVNDSNEIKTFAVTIEAMTLMGFVCDVQVFAEACQVQTGGPIAEIMEAIEMYRRVKRCGQVARKIVRVFDRSDWIA